MTQPLFKLTDGDSPLIISIPHVGFTIPDEVRENYNDIGLGVQDTDWHLDQLYAFAQDMGASMLSATVSRYVIDLNRAPDGSSLYPGKTTTGLCPLETFLGQPIYREGRAPDDAEIARRVATWWKPYHEALAAQIAAVHARHGYVVLWEAHSINSQLPRLFEGVLPNLNFGTVNGASCADAIFSAVLDVARQGPYEVKLNGRFVGGYITRQYNDPARGIHAIQLEMTHKTYMDEPAPFNYRPDLAAKVQPLLRQALTAALDSAGALHG
ncbi:MAG: N-formylglutamate deformylase [Janthinobacterium lividum]